MPCMCGWYEFFIKLDTINIVIFCINFNIQFFYIHKVHRDGQSQTWINRIVKLSN